MFQYVSNESNGDDLVQDLRADVDSHQGLLRALQVSLSRPFREG